MDSAIRLPVFAHVDRDAECLFKQTIGDNDTTIYHSHSFYEIFLIVSGTVTHYINGKNNSFIFQCNHLLSFRIPH